MSRRPRTTPYSVLSPQSSALDFDLTPALEAEFNALARAGRDDPEARNALFARLGVKIARFLAPWRNQETALGTFADLRQEAFVLFADLVIGWPGDGSFARYFLAFFPWRLRHAIAYHERRWPRDRIIPIPYEALFALILGATPPPSDDWLALGDLAPDERRLVALRLGGYSLTATAALLGCSRRTAARRWRALRTRLIGVLAGHAAVGA